MTGARYYLDDKRTAPEGWVPIRDPRIMMSIIRLSGPGEIEAISFDHDLACYFLNKELTGYWVLENIERLVASSDWYCDVIPEDLRVHSANAGIYKKMEQAIESIRRFKSDAS